MLPSYHPVRTPWEAISVKNEDPWCMRSRDMLNEHLVARDEDEQSWIDAAVYEAEDNNGTCVCSAPYKGIVFSKLMEIPDADLFTDEQMYQHVGF